MANGREVSFRGDENVQKLIVVMVAHLCDYTKSCWIGHLKWVSCMNCMSLKLWKCGGSFGAYDIIRHMLCHCRMADWEGKDSKSSDGVNKLIFNRFKNKEASVSTWFHGISCLSLLSTTSHHICPGKWDPVNSDVHHSYVCMGLLLNFILQLL